MPKIIGIVSGKGGVGKTTVTANLGLYLSKVGKDVTIVDCNVTTSHLGFNFGFYSYEKTLNNLLRGEATLEEVIYNYGNLKIIPASLSLNDLINLDLFAIGQFLRNIKSEFVFLDSAPGIGREPMSVLTAAEEVILVAIPYMNAISDVIRIKKILLTLNVKTRGIILNMVKHLPHELTVPEVERLTGLEVIGEIPYDENVNKALSYGVPLIEYNPFAPSAIAIKNIGDSLIGRHAKLNYSFWEKLKLGFRNLFLRKKITDLNELI